jgi:hypothetical protein
MTLYSLVLFLHVAAALALASALSIDALILFQLHRATTSTAAHPWLNLWSAVPRITGSSGLLLLLSGGYLTDRMSAWSLAWPRVALAALILIGILGAITSKRLSALRRICAAEKTNESECLRRLRDPILKTSPRNPARPSETRGLCCVYLSELITLAAVVSPVSRLFSKSTTCVLRLELGSGPGEAVLDPKG